MKFLYYGLSSQLYFTLLISVFVVSSTWIAVASMYPMAFDEEFHYGLIKIYATSVLPYGIEHTSDMAQFGSATADASYLFHYLMSFPYRVFAALQFSDTAIIIALRLMNIAFVAAALAVFRKALLSAHASSATIAVGLTFVCLIPIFPLLAAHINYDNLLLLIFAWCVLSVVGITNSIKNGEPLPLGLSVQLIVGVLLGMSVKYAFLPLAFGLFIWIVWLFVLGYKNHGVTIGRHVASLQAAWRHLIPIKRYILIGVSVVSLFFAAHYVTNTISYGSPIPSCERVFSESECTAYGPWNRNKNMEARKSESFVPVSYAEYMATEWFPGMTQRLTFAVAGKTNNFDTRLPLPALVYLFVILSAEGCISLIVQVIRRKASWLAAFTVLLSVLYAGILSFQLYGDYVDTAEPVAINGRYLIPLLPLVAVVFIQAIRSVLPVTRHALAAGAVVILFLAIISGAGIGTYVVQAGSHWFWPGVAQMSHDFLQMIVERFTLPWRY